MTGYSFGPWFVSDTGAEAHGQVLALLERWKHLGESTLPDRTRRIGKSDVAPEAWTHIVFRPLSESEIASLEEHVELRVPDQYKLFLSLSNGLSLFDDHLSLDGLRSSYDRSGDSVEPYDLRTRNVDERLVDAPEDAFFVGGYDDGSLLYIDARSGEVVRCHEAASEPVESWSDLGTMLVSESQRLMGLDESWR